MRVARLKPSVFLLNVNWTFHKVIKKEYNMDVITEIRSTLKKANLRVTPQRVAICEYLTHNNNHPTALMIYEQVKLSHPNISLMTVYNTLNALTELGIITEIGKFRDEHKRFDNFTDPHLHLMCSQCGSIQDLQLGILEQVEEQVFIETGFVVDRSKLIYYGYCKSCQEKNPTLRQ